MALAHVTLTGTLPGAAGAAGVFVPSGWLTDAPDQLLIPPAPVPFTLSGTPGGPGSFSVLLLATDSTGPLPSGWTWRVSFSGIAGVGELDFSFALYGAPIAFTATNASPCVFTAQGSAYPAGQPVTLTGSSLPAGFSAATTYYVTGVSGSSFSLAATAGGAALASTSAGSGTVAGLAAQDISSLAQVQPASAMAAFLQGTYPGGTTGFLRADGQWAVPPGTGLTNPMSAPGDLIDGGAGGTPQRLAGNTGSTREFLTSTGSGGQATAPAWAAIAPGDLPAATGSAQGAVELAGDLGGTATSPQVTGSHLASPLPLAQGGTGSTARNFAGLLTPTAVKTSAYGAAAGDYVPVDTTSGAVTVTLPAAPADLAVAAVKMVIQGGTNTVTIAASGSDVFNKAGGAASLTLTLLNQGVILQYAHAAGIWYVAADDLALSALDARYLAASATAGGDLSGTYPAPSVAKVAGTAVTGSPASTAFPAGFLLTATDSSDAAWQVPYNPVRGLLRPPRIKYVDELFMGQAGHPFTFSGTGATGSNADTADFVLGVEAVKVTTNGAGANTKISGTFGTALNLTGKHLVMWVKMENYAHFLAGYPRVYLGDTGLANCYYWKITNSAGQPWALDGEWMRITLPFGSSTVAGSPNRASLAALTIQIFDDSAGQVTVHLGGLATMAAPPQFPNGVVSFVFDDGFISQFTTAKPYMDKYGYAGSAFLITETLWNHGSGNFNNYLDLPTAQALEKYSGWECGPHAYTAANHNASYTGISDAAALADMQAAKQYMQVNGFKVPDQFAYPLGNYDAATLLNASQMFSASRSISQIGGFPEETWPPADVTRLRSMTLGNTNSLASAEAAVDRAYANAEWLIFTFHDIQATASTNLQFSTANFQALMDYINAKGIPVMLSSDVLRSGDAQVDPFPADIRPTGTTAAAGAAGMPSDAGHVHAQNFGSIFGNGSDGAATLDGVATAAWASLAGSVYTMSRNAQLTALTINNGVTLIPAGNRVQVMGAVTCNGVLSGPGNNAAGAAAGAATLAGSITGGRPGGAGQTGNGAAGTNGFFGSNSAGAGGAGGTGSAGAAGTVTSSSVRGFETPYPCLTGVSAIFNTTNAIQGGPGGGGGGGDGTNAGGGGGSGGACIQVFAWSFTLGATGSITVPGGNGANGVAGNAGGGGGGGGGVVVLFTLATWTNSGGTTNVAGGNGGTKTGTGSNGSNGGAGTLTNTVVM